jgi:hypothetical protein
VPEFTGQYGTGDTYPYNCEGVQVGEAFAVEVGSSGTLEIAGGGTMTAGPVNGVSFHLYDVDTGVCVRPECFAMSPSGGNATITTPYRRLTPGVHHFVMRASTYEDESFTILNPTIWIRPF